MTEEKSCPDIKDWSSHIYKQKSYTRIPTACFLCGDIQKCIEAYRPSEVEKPQKKKPQKTCPECGTDMEETVLGLDSHEDFVYGWHCPKCGHSEKVKA